MIQKHWSHVRRNRRLWLRERLATWPYIYTFHDHNNYLNDHPYKKEKTPTWPVNDVYLEVTFPFFFIFFFVIFLLFLCSFLDKRVQPLLLVLQSIVSWFLIKYHRGLGFLLDTTGSFIYSKSVVINLSCLSFLCFK